MKSSPLLYQWFVRPKWSARKYIHEPIAAHFSLQNKLVLDFGAGTGANSSMVQPDNYIGIDPDSDRIRYASNRYPSYRFEVFDTDKIPVQDQIVDVILIIAVLHHIDTPSIQRYIHEFRRVLKPGGIIVVMEPYLCPSSPLCNYFMQWYDNGEYIRREQDYLFLFENAQFTCTVLKKFRKCYLYNELFFSAVPQNQ